MSGRLNPLEEEILLIMSNRVRGRWTDIKGDIDEMHKRQYSGSGFDVVFSRSLKRVVDRDILWKHKGGSSHPVYYLSPKGSSLADKIRHGLSVEDKYRDSVLAFSSIIRWHRNMAVITVQSDNVVDYFNYFKKQINEIDVEQFLEELWINERIILSDEDPLDLVDFTDEEIDYEDI